MKRLAEVEARLAIATQSCWRPIGVWKGCGNPPMAPYWLPSMSYLARSASEIVLFLLKKPKFEARSSSSEAVGWGGSKANHCNPQLLETHWGMARMWQPSHGTILAAVHVIFGQKRL